MPDELVIDGEYIPPQPLRIIRETTLDEYLERNPGDVMVAMLSGSMRFYEVSTD